jgi:type IV pilus assembly protein PilO
VFNYDVKRIYEWPLGARVLVLAVISILILLLGYVIDIRPYKEKIQIGRQQESDLKGQLQLMFDKQITMVHDIAQLPDLKALLAKWQQNILSKDELPGVLDQILKLGQDSQLKIVAFNPAREVKDGIYYKTPVTIDMNGTYDQIAAFISKLANMPKIVNIDDFTLNNNSEKTSTVTVTDNTQGLASDTILTAQLDIEIYRK